MGKDMQVMEKTLWAAADKMIGGLSVSNYKFVVLGIIFLKYISDSFEEKYNELVKEGYGLEEVRDAYEEVWKEYYSTKNIFKRFFQHFKRLSFIRAIAFLGENFLTKIQLKGRNSQKVLGGILGEDLKIKY